MAHYDVAVVGGGSGGFAAAWAAARQGLSVLLVERQPRLGGTAVMGGVNCWEMGVGGTGIPFDLYRRLARIPNAIGIYSYGWHASWPRPGEAFRFRGGELVIDPSRTYLDTLRRYRGGDTAPAESFARTYWHGLPFEPEAMSVLQQQLLDETGRCTVRTATTFTAVHTTAGRLVSLTLTGGDTVTANWFIDGTGDGILCAEAGCDFMLGQEGRDRFGEPGAPEQANRRLNGVTLIYRVTRARVEAIEPLPADIPAACWWAKDFPWTSMNTYPNGDRNLNMLPTMEGEEFARLGMEAATGECRRRVLAHWHDLQTVSPEFRRFKLRWIAAMPGVRESRRIVGEYILTQNDLLAGCRGQKADDLIALADHALDTHGQATGRAGCGELSEPYGIPYRCLIPKGIRNLLIACRGASFSSLAASSCRLTRTMMQLGQAAGTATVLASRAHVDLPAVPGPDLRAALSEQRAQVDWPMPADLRDYLAREDPATPGTR